MMLSRLPAVAGVVSALVHTAAGVVLYAVDPPQRRPRSSPVSLEFRPQRAPAPQPEPAPAAPTQVEVQPVSRPQAPPRRSPARPTPAEAPQQPVPAPVPAAGAAPTAVEVPAPAAAPAGPAPAAPAAAPAAASAPAPPRAGSSGGRGVDLVGYLGRITHSVAAKRQYPPMALEMRLEGEVLVTARIRRDGGLAERPVLARSCGHELLDAEALRMVTRAAPLPPLPPDYPAATAELQIPVRFHLED